MVGRVRFFWKMRRRWFVCEKICVVGMVFGGNGVENKNYVCDYLYGWNLNFYLLLIFLENFFFLERED